MIGGSWYIKFINHGIGIYLQHNPKKPVRFPQETHLPFQIPPQHPTYGLHFWSSHHLQARSIFLLYSRCLTYPASLPRDSKRIPPLLLLKLLGMSVEPGNLHPWTLWKGGLAPWEVINYHQFAISPTTVRTKRRKCLPSMKNLFLANDRTRISLFLTHSRTFYQQQNNPARK